MRHTSSGNHTTILFLAIFAIALRAWKTLAVNLPVLYESCASPTTAMAIMAASHLAGCLAVDLACVLNRARGTTALAIPAAVALAALPLLASTLFEDALWAAIALAVLGGMGFEGLAVWFVCSLSAVGSAPRVHLITAMAGFGAVICVAAFLPDAWFIALCVLLAVVAFAASQRIQTPDLAPVEPPTNSKASLSVAVPVLVGVAILFLGFHFFQVGLAGTDTAFFGDTLLATIVPATAGRVVAFVVLAVLARGGEEEFYTSALRLAAVVGIAGFLALPLPVSWSLSAFSTLAIAGCFLAHYAIICASAAMASRRVISIPIIVGWGRIAMNAGHCVGVIAGALLPKTLLVGSPYLGFVTAVSVLILAFAGIVLLRENNLDRLMWGFGMGAEASKPAAATKTNDLRAEFGLTEREAQVAALLAEGRSAPYVAETLFLSLETVKTHVKHIYQKCGVHGRQELIDLFRREGDSA